ncbi:MAG: sulfotransferase [Rhodobacteraceae bacterium]|nr:sulfotransferase [Paracoccaceae bacterium]
MTRIVAISGSGRSGSTLLSLLLSQSDRAFNLGQHRHLPAAWRDDAPCSCDQPLHGCTVYAPVMDAVFGPRAESDIRAFGAAGRRFFKAAGRTRDWHDPQGLDRLRQAHQDYLAPLARLVDAIADATGAETLIDSSKTPEMALAFHLIAPGELLLLNLVRDPRAVAVSWNLKKGSRRDTFSNARKWLQRQKRLSDWGPALGARFRQLRYEDFAAAPEQQIALVHDWAGLVMPPALFPEPDRATLSWGRQHLFPPANEKVLAERKSDVPIRPSMGWRDPGHSWEHRIALLATRPLARQIYPALEDAPPPS